MKRRLSNHRRKLRWARYICVCVCNVRTHTFPRFLQQEKTRISSRDENLVERSFFEERKNVRERDDWKTCEIRVYRSSRWRFVFSRSSDRLVFFSWKSENPRMQQRNRNHHAIRNSKFRCDKQRDTDTRSNRPSSVITRVTRWLAAQILYQYARKSLILAFINLLKIIISLVKLDSHLVE